LHGKPITVKPFAAYFFWSASSVAYCGVLPHCEATLPSIRALPLYAASVVGSPFSGLIGTFHIGSSSLVTATGAGAVPAAGNFAGSNISAVGPYIGSTVKRPVEGSFNGVLAGSVAAFEHAATRKAASARFSMAATLPQV